MQTGGKPRISPVRRSIVESGDSDAKPADPERCDCVEWPVQPENKDQASSQCCDLAAVTGLAGDRTLHRQPLTQSGEFITFSNQLIHFFRI